MHRRLKIYKAKSCIRFFLYKKFAFFNVFIGKKTGIGMVIKEFEGTGNWILVKTEQEWRIKNPYPLPDPV